MDTVKINKYLELMYEEMVIADLPPMKELAPWIVCADGFALSVQASYTHYCSPRTDRGPYSKVEVGYPTEESPELEEFDSGGVYGFVPVEIVDAVIEQHGGIANGVYR